MNAIVIYKSKYGSTKAYAQWIGDALSCPVLDAKNVKPADLAKYDCLIYGGGLYAEVIAGVTLITKNLEALSGKKIAIFTTGITPMEYREYYDKLVLEKNFKTGVPENIKIFNYPGKMILEELSIPHKTAIKALKKLMAKKENPTEMEKLLVDLCDADGDFSDKSLISELVECIKNQDE